VFTLYEAKSSSISSIDTARQALSRISDKEIQIALEPPMFEYFEESP